MKGSVCLKSPGNYKNVFPYEFRPAFHPEFFQINPPSGYAVFDAQSGTFFHTYHDGCTFYSTSVSRLVSADINSVYSPHYDQLGCLYQNTCASQIVSISSNTFNFSPIYSVVTEDPQYDNCGGGYDGDVPSQLANCQNYQLALGDEYFEQNLAVQLRTPCTSPGSTVTYNSGIAVQRFSNFDCSGSFHDENASNISTGTLTQPNPVCSLYVNSQAIFGTTGVSWNISIQNQGPPNPIDQSVAENLFIALPCSTCVTASNIIFTSVQANSTSNNCSPVFVGTTNTGYDVYFIKNLDPPALISSSNPNANIVDFIVSGSELACIGTQGTEDIYWGWNCGDINLDWINHAPCVKNLYHLSYENNEANLITSVKYNGLSSQFTYSKCNTPVEIEVQNPEQGSIYNVIVQINLSSCLPVSFDINSVSVTYTFNGQTVSLPVSQSQITNQNNSYFINLSSYDYLSTAFQSDGQSGISNGENVKISFVLMPPCSYQGSGLNTPSITTSAIKFCDYNPLNQSPSILTSNFASSAWTYDYHDYCDPPCGGSVYINSINYPLICENDNIVLNANLNGNWVGPTFSWTFSGGSGTGSTLSVNPVATTIYTVTVTDAGGNTSTATYTVNVITSTNGCCIPPGFKDNFDFNFSQNTISALLAQYPSITGNSINTQRMILINGQLMIDQSFTFNNCPNVVLGPDAEIIVPSGITLTVTLGTHFYACSDMWNRILAQPGSRVYLYDSFFDDAKQTVESFGHPAEIIIKGNKFNANYNSVYLHDGSFDQVHIMQNDFICGRTLNSPYSSLHSRFQIRLVDALNVSIGEATNLANNINDALYGIYSLRSDLNVDNNNFNSSYTNSRFGIYASGNNSNSFYADYKIKVGLQKSNFISTYLTGVFVSKNYNTDIRYNHFSNLRTAVSINRCKSKAVFVRNNTIDDFILYGIQMQDNDYSNIIISENFINWNNPFLISTESKKAIYVNNSVQSKSNLNIKLNRIANCRFGIQVMNQTLGITETNFIRYEVADALLGVGSIYRNGIIYQECVDMDLAFNQIYRPCHGCSSMSIDPSLLDYLRGINIQQSWTKVHENYVLYMPMANRLYQNCQNTNLYCNLFDNCQEGFYLDQATVDQQGDATNTTDNQWQNFSGNERIGGVSSTQVNWYYNSGLGSDYALINCNPFIVAPFTGITNDNCVKVVPYEETQRKLSDIINDSIYLSNLDENKVAALTKSYQVLKNNLQLLYTGSIYDAELQNFFTAISLSNIGKFENVTELLKDNDLVSAALMNSEIDPQNLIESNTKIVNEIVIANTSDTISLDSLQQANLLTIAYQYPILGGAAVYRARAILHLDIDDTQLAYRLSHPTEQSIPNNFEIYPNPTTGEFSLFYSLDEQDIGVLDIYNGLGQTIAQKKLEAQDNILTLDLSKNQNGIYYLVLNTTSGVTKHWKLILVK